MLLGLTLVLAPLVFSTPVPLYKVVLFMVLEANVSFSLDLNRKNGYFHVEYQLFPCWISVYAKIDLKAGKIRHEFGQIK